MLARKRERLTPKRGVAEPRDGGCISDKHGEPGTRLHANYEPALRERAFECRLSRCLSADAHAAVTPCSTFNEPERKPRRSSATRRKPAASTASRSTENRDGASQCASIACDSSTRARSS